MSSVRFPTCVGDPLVLDDELLLTAAEGVDYGSLPSMPTPEEFYLLSRVKGSTSVAQLCAASGWGKDKARTTIEKLIGFGLLVTDGDDAGSDTSEPAPKSEPASSTQEAEPASSTQPAEPVSSTQPAEPVSATPPASATQEAEPVPASVGGGPGARDPEQTPEKASAQTQEGPAVSATDAAATSLGDTPLVRDRETTPQQQVAVDRTQRPSRDQHATPVRESGSSPGFDLPVIEESEDDLFMSDSPAHLSRMGSSDSNDATTTRPVEEREPVGASAQAGPSDSDFGSSRSEDNEDGAGFAILDSVVEDFGSDGEDDATRMVDPTTLDIANSVAVDGTPVATSRAAAADGPLAFSMLPGKLSDFTLTPELLDPELKIEPRARQEIAYVCANLESVNHYELFGLTPDATRKEIKKAYFVLSKRFHPDLYFRKNVGPFEKMIETVFKAVTGAYQILSHRKRRAAYDLELENTASDDAAAERRDELADKRELAFQLLLKRAKTHEVKGEWVRAADCLRKASSIRTEPGVLIRLANALYKADKRLDDAAKYCKSALREDAKNLDGLLVFANILERQKEYGDALRVLERARDLDPSGSTIDEQEERIRNLMGDS